MRRAAWLLLALSATARADDADVVAPAPASAPAFATLDRADATSRAGITAAYVFLRLPGLDSLQRFDVHGQLVDPRLGLGGYLALPISYSIAAASGSPQTAVGVGDLEAGGIYAPRLPVRDLALALHVGVALPTSSTSALDEQANAYGALARAGDLALADHTTTLRAAASPIWRWRAWFARADVGCDLQRTRALVKLDVAAGVQLDAISVSAESVNLVITNAAAISQGAIAIRAHLGRWEPYAAVTVPLDRASRQIAWAAITAGLDLNLP